MPEPPLGMSKNTEPETIGREYDLNETLIECPTSIVLQGDDIRLPFLQRVTAISAPGPQLHPALGHGSERS